MKYPVVIPYIRTRDIGQELRYSLRSLGNITNWNGEVYVAGDKELWFSSRVKYYNCRRLLKQPYYDQVNKMLSIIDELPGSFIASQDDLYAARTIKVGVYHQGRFKNETNSYHKRTKNFTAETLIGLGLKEPLDFELHVPMLVRTAKMKEILEFIRSHPNRDMLQWRSLYGNIYGVNARQINDSKTKTTHLKEGDMISTNFYTNELDRLFPKPSEFEL